MYLRISNSSNMLHHTVSANTSCLTQNFPKLIRTRYLSQLPAHKSFWNWTTQVRPSWRQSYKEAAIIFTVFGITGSSSLFFVRPALKYTIGLEGSFIEGPNSYRVASLFLVSPVYAMILLTLGTLSGRHNFFAKMSVRILGRFMPKRLSNELLCTSAKQKLV